MFRQSTVLVALILCMILSGGCVSSNNCPVISSLEVEKDWVAPSGSCEVECVASDPDGDELSFQWVATRGNLSGQGSAVTWTAPNTCGDYVVMVTVADSRGSEVSRELEIKVIKPG